MSFDSIWKSIEQDAKYSSGDIGIIRRRILPEGRCNLYIGTERPSGRRVLILCLKNSAIRKSDPLPKAIGIDVQVSRLPDDPPEHKCIYMALNDTSCRDIFTILATDIANYVSLTPDDRKAMEQLITRLLRWQKFLERFGTEGLSENAQHGLFGELWFIKKYLLNVFEPDSITGWVGPEKALQDFQLGKVAVEVKVSASKEHQKLHIAGEKQLESSLGLDIILFFLSLNLVKNTGTNLPALISDIRSKLSENPIALDCFNDRLLQSGYLDIHESRYTETGYIIRKQSMFHVLDNFPRITGAELRPGVGDVEYTISVAECKHYEIDNAKFISILEDRR